MKMLSSEDTIKELIKVLQKRTKTKYRLSSIEKKFKETKFTKEERRILRMIIKHCDVKTIKYIGKGKYKINSDSYLTIRNDIVKYCENNTLKNGRNIFTYCKISPDVSVIREMHDINKSTVKYEKNLKNGAEKWDIR